MEAKECIKKIIKEDNGRNGIVFSTKKKKYMYDTGTGKVFECSKVEYEI